MAIRRDGQLMTSGRESPQDSCALTDLRESIICPKCSKPLQIPYEVEDSWRVFPAKVICPGCKRNISQQVLQILLARGLKSKGSRMVLDYVNSNAHDRRDGLTKMQKTFCLELIKLGGIHGDKTLAARNAGAAPKNACIQAQKWLRLAKVQEELARLGVGIKKKAQEEEGKALLDALATERRLDMIIDSNPKSYFDENGDFKPVKDLAEKEAYAIAEVTRIETELGAHQKLKFCDKLAAIKMKMQRLGLLQQKVDVAVMQETYEQRRIRLGLDSRVPPITTKMPGKIDQVG